MKVNTGAIIKKLRLDAGLTQVEMAEMLFVDTRQISRFESGDFKMDVWQLMSMLQIFGQPSDDFWLFFLDSEDYNGYRAYRKLKSDLRNENYDEATKSLELLEKSSVSTKRFVRQIVSWAKIYLDKELTNEEALVQLYEVLKVSKPEFDEEKLSDYRLNYQEMRILLHISVCYSAIGDKERAIYIAEALIESREKSRTSEEDRAVFFPVLFSNLSNHYGQIGELKKSMEVCRRGLEISREYNNFRFVPKLLLNLASCLCLLGEEEQIYKPHVVRAYHCAYAMGLTKVAKDIKRDAEEHFGITDL